MKKKLKLFVWRDFNCDYTCGVAFALAETVEEARELICPNNDPYVKDALQVDPEIYETKFGFHVNGGS